MRSPWEQRSPAAQPQRPQLPTQTTHGETAASSATPALSWNPTSVTLTNEGFEAPRKQLLQPKRSPWVAHGPR